VRAAGRPGARDQGDLHGRRPAGARRPPGRGAVPHRDRGPAQRAAARRRRRGADVGVRGGMPGHARGQRRRQRLRARAAHLRGRAGLDAGPGRRGRRDAGHPLRTGPGHDRPAGPPGGSGPAVRRPGRAVRSVEEPTMDAKITVLIADDHTVVRQGLRLLLDLADDIEVVGEAADGTEVAELATALAPDVILLDLKLPGLDGLAVLADLADRGVASRVLVLTSVTDPASVMVAMRAGAAGFLYKDVDPDA